MPACCCLLLLPAAACCLLLPAAACCCLLLLLLHRVPCEPRTGWRAFECLLASLHDPTQYSAP